MCVNEWSVTTVAIAYDTSVKKPSSAFLLWFSDSGGMTGKERHPQARLTPTSRTRGTHTPAQGSSLRLPVWLPLIHSQLFV